MRTVTPSLTGQFIPKSGKTGKPFTRVCKRTRSKGKRSIYRGGRFDAKYRGKQDLFTRQAPQKLEKLREHALIESAVASNRIEGVEIDQKRVGTVIFGKSRL